MVLPYWLPLLAVLRAPAPPVTTLSGHLDHAPAGDTVQLDVGTRHLKAPLDPRGDFYFELKDLAAPAPVHF